MQCGMRSLHSGCVCEPKEASRCFLPASLEAVDLRREKSVLSSSTTCTLCKGRNVLCFLLSSFYFYTSSLSAPLAAASPGSIPYNCQATLPLVAPSAPL